MLQYVIIGISIIHTTPLRSAVEISYESFTTLTLAPDEQPRPKSCQHTNEVKKNTTKKTPPWDYHFQAFKMYYFEASNHTVFSFTVNRHIQLEVNEQTSMPPQRLTLI